MGLKFTLLPKEFDKDGAHYYLADVLSEDGEEAAYLWFRDEGMDWMLLHDLQVYEKFSRAGIGPLLVRIVEDEAKRKGKKKIIGHVEAHLYLSGQKEILVSWYRRMGYSVVPIESSRPDYYGTLEKKLL